MEAGDLPENPEGGLNLLVWRWKLYRKEKIDGRIRKNENSGIMKEPQMTKKRTGNNS